MTTQEHPPLVHTLPMDYDPAKVTEGRHPARCHTLAPVSEMLPQDFVLNFNVRPKSANPRVKLCGLCHPRPTHVRITDEQYLKVMPGRETGQAFCKASIDTGRQYTLTVNQAVIQAIRGDHKELCKYCLDAQAKAAEELEALKGQDQ